MRTDMEWEVAIFTKDGPAPRFPPIEPRDGRGSPQTKKLWKRFTARAFVLPLGHFQLGF